MENNISDAMNQIQEMLSSDEGRKNLQNIMNSISGGTNTQEFTEPRADIESAPDKASSLMGGLNPELINMAQTFMTGMKPDNSPRSRLLTALKPYLSKSRHNHIDNAIRILSLGNIPEIMKNFRK